MDRTEVWDIDGTASVTLEAGEFRVEISEDSDETLRSITSLAAHLAEEARRDLADRSKIDVRSDEELNSDAEFFEAFAEWAKKQLNQRATRKNLG